MLSILGLREYTIDWQHLVCLLCALDELGAGGHRRRDVCEFIHRHHYLHLTRDDVAPYPTQAEPSWQTDIAYARKIGVIMGVVGYEERDSWELVRDGRSELKRIVTAGERGEIDGKQCFLWSADFRRRFDRGYSPSPGDAPRPPKRFRGIANRHIVTRAKELVASGEAIELAPRLSAQLGFRVMTDVRSIATAIELLNQQLTERAQRSIKA